MLVRTYSESTFGDIPLTQGMYAFYLDLVSPAKIGLLGAGPWQESQLQQARKLLQSRMRKQVAVLRSLSMTGQLVESDKRQHMTFHFQLVAKEIASDASSRNIESLALDSVRDYAMML